MSESEAKDQRVRNSPDAEAKDAPEVAKRDLGDIVGLLFDRSIHSHVSLTTVQTINAAYVPLNATLPAERIGFFSDGAMVETVREIEYTDAAQQETAQRAALTPLSRPG